MARPRARAVESCVNLPIGLTITRIVAVPLLIVFLISSSRVHALIAAAIFVARRRSPTGWTASSPAAATR